MIISLLKHFSLYFKIISFLLYKSKGVIFRNEINKKNYLLKPNSRDKIGKNHIYFQNLVFNKKDRKYKFSVFFIYLKHVFKHRQNLLLK